MRLVDLSVDRPVRVWVVVLLAALFGVIALTTLPLQLAPTVDRPEITVETEYPGAAPLEVEQQLTDKIEEKVNSVEGVDEIDSTSREGQSSIVLKFDWGVDKDVARLDVSEKLGLVKDLPEDIDRSVIRAVNSDEEQPVAWIVVDTDLDVIELSDEIDDVSKARFERLPGVGSVLYFGGRDREVHVVLDLDALSARGLSVSDVRAALTGENRNERGGTIEAGKTRWVVRTVGQFTRLSDVEDTVVATGEGGTPVRVRDVARVRFGREKRDAIVRQDGRPALVMGILRRTGANVVEVMRGVRAEIEYQNRVVFRGRPIRLVQVYDETEYIEDAKGLLVGNLVVGALLATAVLVLFLKSLTSTIVIGLSIPTSLLTTFVVLQALGRSLNVISLAGLAFASGMVVDNSIVVLENVFRHRTELGKPLLRAARDGTVEVWGALVASTLTTLAVFIPIVFVKEEAGQLFRDIAIAISGAVGLSLLVAITVVPMLCARVLRTPADGAPGPLARLGAGLLRPVDALGRLFVDATGAMVAWLERGLLRRVVYLGLVLGAAVWAFLALLPPRDYLPQGNRNLILSIAKVPAGYGLEEQDRIVSVLEKRMLADPRVQHIFSVVGLQTTLVGTIVRKDAASVSGMQAMLGDVRRMTFGIPGAMFFVTQAPIFRRSGGFIGGTTAEVTLRGSDLEALAAAAGRVEGASRAVPGVIFVRSSFDFGNPEMQVVVDRAKAADLGLRVQDVGYAVATLVDGTKAGIFREEGKERDVRLLGPNAGLAAAGDLERLRLVVPRGGAVRLSDLAQVRAAEGPTKVEHKDLDRSVTVTVGFQEGVALDEAVDRIERTVLEPLRPGLPVGFTADVGGQAKDLDKTWASLSGAFLLGLLVIYLLMAMLFDSFLYPLVIMLTVPFAMTGGVVGAALAHAMQPLVLMDVITMLGFVILAGTVVNNSILIVHQALNFRREEGLPLSDALVRSVRTRIRPIFMTVVTTVLGMLPLALTEGSGSELYRGLGSVVIGGLVVSTLFTLTVTPAFMSLAMDLKAGGARLLRAVLSPFRRGGGGAPGAGGAGGEGRAPATAPEAAAPVALRDAPDAAAP